MSKKPASKPAPAPTPADPASDALRADPGPLIVSLAVNRVTGMLGMAGNAASEHDLRLVLDALGMAQTQVHQQLLAEAEARGKAQAESAAQNGNGKADK